MIRFTFLLFIAMNCVSSFMVDRPVVGGRIRDTRAFVAASTASRTLVEDPSSTPVNPTVSAVNGKPMITSLKSEDDYQSFLGEDDRLVMVKFYAPYCKSCQKFGMQYNRIGKEIGDLAARNKDGSETIVREGEVRMAEMEYGANRDLCKRLGVKKLPSVHFYSQGKLVDGFPCGPSKIGKVLEKLSEYRSMTPAELSFEADMKEGMALGDNVLTTLNQRMKIEVTNKPTPQVAFSPSC